MKIELDIPADDVMLKGDIVVPDNSKGLVIFSHGSGSSRLSPRNRFVAYTLETQGFATLLFDLLTEKEDLNYQTRFDIDLLTQRLVKATEWLKSQQDYKQLNAGYFGASTGAASALRAAAVLGPEVVKAVVSRGGRPDLAERVLESVKSPILLLAGELDTPVIKLNQQAFKKMRCIKKLTIIPGASHLFEEPGTLEEVTRHANEWFLKYLYRYQKEIEKDFIK
ncbi:dienelactone hydrolase family protein [Halalkalibaculum sp. DA384]|uniref:dienelactone hydrolase family protein n=1 Tax=Halalkalibaculum sp. DA384 TaxID=3373606 RepID=UPI003754E427